MGKSTNIYAIKYKLVPYNPLLCSLRYAYLLLKYLNAASFAGVKQQLIYTNNKAPTAV